MKLKQSISITLVLIAAIGIAIGVSTKRKSTPRNVAPLTDDSNLQFQTLRWMNSQNPIKLLLKPLKVDESEEDEEYNKGEPTGKYENQYKQFYYEGLSVRIHASQTKGLKEHVCEVVVANKNFSLPLGIQIGDTRSSVEEKAKSLYVEQRTASWTVYRFTEPEMRFLEGHLMMAFVFENNSLRKMGLRYGWPPSTPTAPQWWPFIDPK
jgi:hypothetical protein